MVSTGFTLVEEDDVAFTLSMCREVHRIYGGYQDGSLVANESLKDGLLITIEMLAALTNAIDGGMPSMRIAVAATQTREMLAVMFDEDPMQKPVADKLWGPRRPMVGPAARPVQSPVKGLVGGPAEGPVEGRLDGPGPGPGPGQGTVTATAPAPSTAPWRALSVASWRRRCQRTCLRPSKRRKGPAPRGGPVVCGGCSAAVAADGTVPPSLGAVLGSRRHFVPWRAQIRAEKSDQRRESTQFRLPPPGLAGATRAG